MMGTVSTYKPLFAGLNLPRPQIQSIRKEKVTPPGSNMA